MKREKTTAGARKLLEARGWKVGDWLQWNDDCDYVVRVTAIGESAVLLRRKGCAEFCRSELPLNTVKVEKP